MQGWIGYRFVSQSVFSSLVIHRPQDSEKSKVLQSIASVIQAMPPNDEIPVIEVSLESSFDDPF
jgi:hypothetical protein